MGMFVASGWLEYGEWHHLIPHFFPRVSYTIPGNVLKASIGIVKQLAITYKHDTG